MQEHLTNVEIREFLSTSGLTNEIEFLEEGKEKNELLESARKRGIIISKDDRDLGVIKTIYCFTTKANKNKVRLPKKEFVKVFPQIIGRPMDYGHNRRFILGFYIDYRYILKDEKAIAYAIFFKSVYPELWKRAKKLQKAKKLSSSFEIWSPEDEREYLSDGTYYLHDIAIAGGALIFEDEEEPAFKDAKVLSMASKEVQECIDDKCLVYASKYDNEHIITSSGDYFKDSVKENYKKIQEDKKLQAEKIAEPKPEVKEAEPKVEVKREEKPIEENPKTEIEQPVVNKIKCSNCGEEFEFNGIEVEVKCAKCFAILDKEGKMKYPPQIKDFKVLCPSCNIDNWRILSRNETELELKCMSCAKNYKATFKKEKPNETIKKFSFVYMSSARCYQCGHNISISGISGLKTRDIKCPKCGLEFSYNITEEKYKTFTKIEEIQKGAPEKASQKSLEQGGTKVMEFKLETSKYHRYVDDFDKLEATLSDDYGESKKVEVAKRLTTEQRNALPDSMFAVVIRVKDKRTGKTRKIRMYPINDEAHVRNALARLGQPAPQATLKRLGVSIEKVRAKILSRARQLKMTTLLERYKKASEIKKVEVKKAEKAIKQPKAKETPKAEVTPKAVETPKAEIAPQAEEIANTNIKLELYKKAIYKAVSKIRDLKKKNKKAKEDAEIKVAFYKTNAEEINKRRAEVGDFGRGISDEDILKDENFAKIKADKENAKIAEASMNVGLKAKDNDYYTILRKEIDDRAFGRKK